MQRLLIRTFTRPNEKFNSPLPFQTILRHYSSESKSGLGRTRLMKSQPSPTTSTEPPTRIPKPISHVQPDAVLDEATKANLASNPNATFQSNEEEVLYERTPTWWIKWVWILIVDPPKDRPLTPEELKEVEWVPRPLWQRAGLSLLVLAGGTGIAAALLLAQARTITRIVRLPEATKARIETARNWPGRGKVIDLTEVTARKGRDETEVIAKLPGSRGEFLIGLDGAKIRGEAGEIGQVKQNFNHTFSQWKGLGREINPTSPALGRWKSGPAA
ncbi:hypothetical protein AG1IA_03849 [Rhizoctonia solani AG-1 IA]|uniref:Uncharacterized protein n=1 Tax=Thanatephorus cucumeris (strain AG1-IA) TaxID=983506 RepID=L8WVG5_THACA|nr:hypothetical protein AG1IA_03849 [Rhizoctonia solani AG-1 IA]